MTLENAKLFDALLIKMANTPRHGFTSEHFRKEMPNLYSVWSSFTQTALADGYIDFIKHPGAPTHNFGIYSITPTGSKFILHDGGYVKRRKWEQYNNTNIKFTWIRHWVWFYTAAVSLTLNLFFIAKYLLKLI